MGRPKAVLLLLALFASFGVPFFLIIRHSDQLTRTSINHLNLETQPEPERRSLTNFGTQSVRTTLHSDEANHRLSPSVPVVSAACMTIYEQGGGGAPAVFRSPECPGWVLPPESHQNQSFNCQFKTAQGRRKYQEDRISCNLDMKIPMLGENGPEEAKVGVVAVFDGHIGQEASEMASKLVMDYLYLHSVFCSFKDWLVLEGFEDEEAKQQKSTLGLGSHINAGTLPVTSNGLEHRGVLKQALLRTINDVDTAFTEVALEKGFNAGSTAVVALLVDGQILVANVGDSKALLCSEKLHSHQKADGTSTIHIYPKELTRDHSPRREEERKRIEEAGGHISDPDYGDPVINGHFPMTRAIGDVPLKMYGIIPDPEVTDWQTSTPEDRYLVISSDGIFESLNPQSVCDLLGDANFRPSKKLKRSPSCLSKSSLADCIFDKAFAKGSTDNLSVIVVPLH